MLKDSNTAIKQLNHMASQGNTMRLAAESWKSDFQILISTIMSARTRDEVTIPVAEALFSKYPDAKSLAKARLNDVKKIIKPVNFYNNKAKNILNCAKTLIVKYRKVPHDFESLVTLPGVGRKTANVFLNEVGYDNIGIDTHVTYISRYLGWTQGKNQKEIEEDIKALFPKKYWSKVNETLVRFGKTHTSRQQKNALLDQIKKIG